MGEQRAFLDLIMDRGPQTGARFPLSKPSVTIGRAPDNDLVIQDADVSRQHARLTWDGSRVIVEDLGSVNGTFVNGARISGPVVLMPGDRLGLAQTVTFSAAPPGAAVPAPIHTPPPPPSGGARWLWIPVVALLGLCVCVAAIAGAGYYWQQRQNVSVPSVSITSPRMNTQVEVGRPVPVDLIAYDTKDKITRLELWVDGHLRETRSSAFPEGISPMPLSVDWRPETSGMHTLAARAYNRSGMRGHATISLEAAEAPDRDRDNIPDSEDACPDEAGPESAEGCPDRDLDGIPDSVDTCPDEPGTPENNGCPNPQPDDRDGDGVLDTVDACPDERGPAWTAGCPDRDEDGVLDAVDVCPDVPGLAEHGGCPPPGDRDADGLPDEEDACPDERGSPDADGCPDRDGDSVRDDTDACPDDWGLPELGGCPDRDADGIADREDACPDEAGPPELHGCPDRGAGDRDEDGVPDDADVSPDERGDPEDGGAPPPGEGEDADGDGIPDEDEVPGDPLDDLGPFGDMGADTVVWTVQLEALEFEVDDAYDEVYCYAGVVGRDMEQFGPFEPEGERQWDIADVLGGENSVMLYVHDGEPLSLQIEGGGQNIFMQEGGAWGTYYDLGSIIRDHPESDWDGHVISARSEGGTDGRSFQVRYRLCKGSCEDTDFPPPIASLINFPEGKRVYWLWYGDEADIGAFKLYRDGNVALAPIPRDTRSESVRMFEPTCGRRVTFNVTAYRDDRESPLSNNVYWSGPSCPRTVQVTFEMFSTGLIPCHGIGCPEEWGGRFWAVGSDGRQDLRFRSVSYDVSMESYGDLNIQEIFDEIIRHWDECPFSGCPDWLAPETNSLIVELGPYDDLTFGGYIWDEDQTLFNGEDTLRARDIVPGEYTIYDRYITLHILIDVLVGPEAGDGVHPDLTIAGVVESEPGRIAIRAFNNAADLEPTDVEVNLVRISTNESIGVLTWPSVSIPSGAEQILVTEEGLDLEPYDLRLIIDPDNRINEGPEGEGNNIYETPVTLRVEFLGAHAGHCNENACSIFDCDSEHVFRLWVGHGPSRAEAEWVAYNVRFPQSGQLVVCGHDICRHSESPDEAWIMEGNPRYTFEFEMPPVDDLFIEAGGYEQDVFNSDDSLGYIRQTYTPSRNWGAQSEEYRHSSSEDDVVCDDTVCTPCNGMTASWRITRVH